MGEEIKSAREIAMEKLEKLGDLTEDERLEFKYVPEGEKLAAEYMKQELNLVAELGNYEEKAKKYVTKGATDIFVRNISLPKDDLARRNTKRAMEGLKTLKSDKAAVENVYSRIRRVFEHYTSQGEQQKKQAYESLKADFEARVQQVMQQQMGTTMGMKIDVERQPQFQEEWHKVQVQMESQYIKLIDEYKQELLAIA